MSEQLNLMLTVSQTVHRTEIQCLFTKFTLRKDLARGRIAIHRTFYLGINHTKNPTEKPWFKASAMEVNKLNSLMKTMADKAGFDEKRRLTNHSARKTMIQKLNDNNIPPTHIMQLSGHRNVQSVNNYSAVLNEQQKNMCFTLSGNTTSTSFEKSPVSSSRSGVATEYCQSSFMKSSSFPAAGPFSGAVFHGGQFNITINTINKSPTSTDH